MASKLDMEFVKAVRCSIAMPGKTPLENALYGFETLVNEVIRLEGLLEKSEKMQKVVDAAKEIRFVGNGKGHECIEPKRGGALARLRVALSELKLDVDPK